MNTPAVTITLDVLLRQYRLGLVQITGESAPAASEVPVQWVHGSDLLNPTPFLTPRTVLLTTGTQFISQKDEATAHQTYVSQLVAAGVCALGFAVNVQYDRIPESLVSACEALGLPLFRVPYSTPFIAISQTAARLMNEQANERDSWSIRAQRAIALAALQREGLAAVLRELSVQLGSWVALFDATGRLVTCHPAQAADSASDASVVDDVQTMLQQQTRASRTLERGDQRIALQSLGRRGNLLGVLAIEGAERLDYAAQSVVGIAIALASVTLEQNSALTEPLEQLRSAVIELLLDGDVTLAQKIASGPVRQLPGEPIVCASIVPKPESRSAFLTRLQALEDSGVYAFFHALIEDEVIVIAAERASTKLSEALADAPAPVGLSRPGNYAGFRAVLDQARLARNAVPVDDQTQVRAYSNALDFSVLDVLSSDLEALRRADALLEPLLSNDDRNGEDLTETVRLWVSNDGQFAPTATALGIHRHTLKSRISRASQVLGKDLTRFDVRAELWVALRIRSS